MPKTSAEKKTPSPHRWTSRTFWHPPAVTLIEVALPEQYVLQTEFSLRRLPQRIDLLVIRREAPPTVETDASWKGRPEARLFHVLTRIFWQEGLSTEGMTEGARAVYNAVYNSKGWPEAASRGWPDDFSPLLNPDLNPPGFGRGP